MINDLIILLAYYPWITEKVRRVVRKLHRPSANLSNVANGERRTIRLRSAVLTHLLHRTDANAFARSCPPK
jgi:hypothetical protein